MPCRRTPSPVGRHSTSPGPRPRTFAAHTKSGSRRKPNGKKRLVGTAAICFLGGKDLRRPRSQCSGNITFTRFPSSRPLTAGRRDEAPMACIIWRGTPPSGSRTGLGSTTMRPCRIVTLTDLPTAGTRWCAEDRGRVRRLCCERLREAEHHRIGAPRPSGFAVHGPLDRRR